MGSVGLIGVGAMGRYYAQRIKERGWDLTVFDVASEKRAWAQAQGIPVVLTPRHLTENCDVLLLAVPGSKEVAEVMEGEDGVLTNLRSGQLVINTSTTHPDTDVRYERMCTERGTGYVDAPVTWRSQGLIVMVGGTEENFVRAKPVLEAIAYKVVHVGPIGYGQRLKAVNQLIGACQRAVWCEAAEFAKGLGLDPRWIRTVLELPLPEDVLSGDFSGTGQLHLHYKDLGYILALGHEYKLALPITAVVHEIFKATSRYGAPDWTQAGIVTFWQRLNQSETK